MVKETEDRSLFGGRFAVGLQCCFLSGNGTWSRAFMTVFSGYRLWRKKLATSSAFSSKSASSEHRRRSLRNWENGMLFLVLGS